MRMKLVILASFLLPSIAAADDRVTSLDALFARYNELGQFNGAVLIAEDNEILLRRGYGFRDQEAGAKNTPDTQFFVGSISKSFTADLVFRLVDEGLINLDDVITDHLSYYRSDTGSKITIRHLVSHTDGLFNYTNIPEFWQPYDGEPMSTKEFVQTYCSSDLQFEPGSEYRYGNSSYSILGAIIEEVSGKPFAEELHTRILDPVGMRSSGDVTAGPHDGRLAKGYQIGPDGFRLADPVYKPFLAAAGMYTTVDDLYAYVESIDQGCTHRTAIKCRGRRSVHVWLDSR